MYPYCNGYATHTSQQIFGPLQYRNDHDMTQITFGTDVLALEQIDMPAVQTS